MPYANPEVKRARQAEYRARNRALLVGKESSRQAKIKASDPESFLAKHREWRAKRVAEGRHDRSRDAERSRARYQRLKGDACFRVRNVRRAVEWRRNLDLSDPRNLQRRIAIRLRSRLRKAIGRGPKTASAVKWLGCSVADLIAHLESQFQPGMNWGNYGEWHIDHVRPLVSFNLADPNQAAEACHYTNLQPLWAQENIRKGAKVGKPRPITWPGNYEIAMSTVLGEGEPT